MATLTTQVIDTDGLTATYTAAASGGDKCTTGDNVFLHVKNAGAASHTVTLATPGTVDGLAVADRAVVVAAGAEAFIALPTSLYRNADDGLASITYNSVEAGFTVACIRS